MSPSQYDSLEIRDFTRADLKAIKKIGAANHGHSHFYNEIRFSPERVQDLFQKWLEKCANGTANKILIAENNSRPVGFATLMVSELLASYMNMRIGVIDFIVADRSAQGKGISVQLLQSALNWLFERVDLVELRTMVDNLRAIRFYQKHGFRILSSDHHLHYWNELSGD